MRNRRRFNQTEPLQDRLAAFAAKAREKARSCEGSERDELLQKARSAETAARVDRWAKSPGLQVAE
jgi:hypothetical protein